MHTEPQLIHFFEAEESHEETPGFPQEQAGVQFFLSETGNEFN